MKEYDQAETAESEDQREPAKQERTDAERAEAFVQWLHAAVDETNPFQQFAEQSARTTPDMRSQLAQRVSKAPPDPTFGGSRPARQVGPKCSCGKDFPQCAHPACLHRGKWD